MSHMDAEIIIIIDFGIPSFGSILDLASQV